MKIELVFFSKLFNELATRYAYMLGPSVRRIKYGRRMLRMTTSKSIGLVLRSPVSRGLRTVQVLACQMWYLKVGLTIRALPTNRIKYYTQRYLTQNVSTCYINNGISGKPSSNIHNVIAHVRTDSNFSTRAIVCLLNNTYLNTQDQMPVACSCLGISL